MNLNPLGSQFFRYRKRKQISVDGRTPGLEYPTRHHGSTPPPTTGHAAQHSSGYDYLGAHDRAEYDPGHAFYSPSSPNYHPIQPWHDLHFSSTPELKTPPGASFPAISPDHSLPDILLDSDTNRRTEIEIADIWRRVLSQVAYQNSVDMGNLIGTVAEQLGIPPPTQACIEQFIETGDSTVEDDFTNPGQPELLFDPAFPESADAIEAQDDDQLSEQTANGAKQLSLEDIVEQEWGQLNSFPMRETVIDPFDQFPPGMPMDPFGPTGFGM